MHLALHYAKDIENFASTFNATTMLGEQKHKVFKMHAQHTNSHENDLQLLKLINTLQTVRFALDNTFAMSSPALTTQLHSIVNRCPVLKQKFIGIPENTFTSTCNLEDCIDVSSSLLSSVNTGRPVALKSIRELDRQYDRDLLTDAYGIEYDTPITLTKRIKFNIKYWGYLSGEASESAKQRRLVDIDGNHSFRAVIGSFIRVDGDAYMHA